MTSPTIAASSFGPLAFVNEARVAFEPWRLIARSPRLVRRTPRPATVIVLPGLGGNDLSTYPLRWYLRRIGHHVVGWGLGVHRADPLSSLNDFKARLREVVDEVGGPVTLVGWSLGGVIARESARDLPGLVDQVVTFGSPINGLRHTSAPWMFDEAALRYIERVDMRRRRRPIRVPITSIYSRNDGVVDWRHAIDDHTPTAVNVEVHSSHIGLGVDPDVWTAVADALDTAGAARSGRRAMAGPTRCRLKRHVDD